MENSWNFDGWSLYEPWIVISIPGLNLRYSLIYYARNCILKIFIYNLLSSDFVMFCLILDPGENRKQWSIAEVTDKEYCQAKKVLYTLTKYEGVQWLSGRVLDSRSKGCGFKPHRRHCVMSLSKTH